jgi:hypothetical protein
LDEIVCSPNDALERTPQTEAATASLTEASVEDFAAQGLTREWVADQLIKYAQAVDRIAPEKLLENGANPAPHSPHA